jgi:hypothetical protein
LRLRHERRVGLPDRLDGARAGAVEIAAYEKLAVWAARGFDVEARLIAIIASKIDDAVGLLAAGGAASGSTGP